MVALIDFLFDTIPDSGPATSYDASGVSRTLVGISSPSTSSFHPFPSSSSSSSFVSRQTRPRRATTGECGYSNLLDGWCTTPTIPKRRLICSQRTSLHRHRTKRWDRRLSYPFPIIPICPVPPLLPYPHSVRCFPMMRTHHGAIRCTVHHPFILKVN